MTLLLSLYSSHGIVFAADSAITITKQGKTTRNNGTADPAQNEQDKLLEWETTERCTVQIQAPRVQVDHPMWPVFSSDAGDVTVREMPGGGHIVEGRLPDA